MSAGAGGGGEVETSRPGLVLVLSTIEVELPSAEIAVESVADIGLEVIPLEVGTGVGTLDNDKARIYK